MKKKEKTIRGTFLSECGVVSMIRHSFFIVVFHKVVCSRSLGVVIHLNELYK